MENFDSEFITEIKDDLEILEPDLLRMEKAGGHVEAELINHAFRAIHSIKGGAGFCGMKDLGELSHAMENVLMRVRDGRLDLTSAMVDGLLAGFDKMKLMVESLDTGMAVSFESERQRLESIIHPVEAAPPDTAVEVKDVSEQGLTPVKAPAPVTEKPLQSEPPTLPARASQKPVDDDLYYYRVRIDGTRDLLVRGRSVEDLIRDAGEAGRIVETDLDQDLAGDALKDRDFVLIIGTILDIAFLAEVLEVPREDIVSTEPPGDTAPEGVSTTSEVNSAVAPLVKARIPDREETAAEIPLSSPSRNALRRTGPDKHSAHPGETGEAEAELVSASSDQAPAAKAVVGGSEARKPAETIRVNVDLITRLMNLAGELVLSRNQLRPLIEPHTRENGAIGTVMQSLNLVTTEIQEEIMQMRLQPVGNVLGRFKRIVRDLAKSLSKSVDLTIEGSEVELDKTVLEGLANPLTHLMRNCVDHGIESPAARRAAGKSETGCIAVRAFHQGGHVHIVIQDDGKGIDPESVASIAVDRGLVTSAKVRQMSDREKTNLIFLPGLSTSASVTDLSGRGVGMDVVRTNIERLRGAIHIESNPGVGTTVQIIIPLTLAIVSALVVGSGGLRFAIPQVNLSEVVYLQPGDLQQTVEHIGDSVVMRFRGRLLPVLRLRTLLGVRTEYTDDESGTSFPERRKAIADRRQRWTETVDEEQRSCGSDRRRNDWDAVYVVVLKVGLYRFGLCVEELFDNEEIVVKPLSDHFQDCRCFSGATILGDGSVIMILDAQGIAGFAGLRFDAVSAEEERRREAESEMNTAQNQSSNIIIFSSADNEFFALSLNSVARLEAIRPKDIHHAGDRKYMQYNESTIALFCLDEFLPVSGCRFDQEPLHVIIPKGMRVTAGILAQTIVDTMEFSRAINTDGASKNGIEGTAFIDGRLVHFINLDQISATMEEMITKRSATV